MDSEIQTLKKEIEELKALSTETHRLVSKMYSNIRLQTIVNGVKWFILIGITIGAFYFVQPLLDSLMRTYSNVTGLNGLNGLNANSLQNQNLTDLLKKF